MLQDHRAATAWAGSFGDHEGYLVGLMHASGVEIGREAATLSVYRKPVALNAPYEPLPPRVKAVMSAAMEAARTVSNAPERVVWEDLAQEGEYRLPVPGLEVIAGQLGQSQDLSHDQGQGEHARGGKEEGETGRNGGNREVFK